MAFPQHNPLKKKKKIEIFEYWNIGIIECLNMLVCADLASEDALSKFLPPLSFIGFRVPGNNTNKKMACVCSFILQMLVQILLLLLQ